MQTDENIKVAEGRNRVYYWLAQFFLMKPTLNGLISALNPTLLLAIDEMLGESGAESLEWLNRFADNMDQEAVDNLAQRYDELFHIPIPGKYVPPYESCFSDALYSQSVSGYGEMWGRATSQVSEFYLRNGFESTVTGTPPDHVGLELLFLSKMCEREAQASGENNQGDARNLQGEEARFLSEHLYTWLPIFTDKVVKAGNSDFYSNICNLTLKFVEQDLEYLRTPNENLPYS